MESSSLGRGLPDCAEIWCTSALRFTPSPICVWWDVKPCSIIKIKALRRLPGSVQFVGRCVREIVFLLLFIKDIEDDDDDERRTYKTHLTASIAVQ